jgi:hypothetical protein
VHNLFSTDFNFQSVDLTFCVWLSRAPLGARQARLIQASGDPRVASSPRLQLGLVSAAPGPKGRVHRRHLVPGATAPGRRPSRESEDVRSSPLVLSLRRRGDRSSTRRLRRHSAGVRPALPRCDCSPMHSRPQFGGRAGGPAVAAGARRRTALTSHVTRRRTPGHGRMRRARPAPARPAPTAAAVAAHPWAQACPMRAWSMTVDGSRPLRSRRLSQVQAHTSPLLPTPRRLNPRRREALI